MGRHWCEISTRGSQSKHDFKRCLLTNVWYILEGLGPTGDLTLICSIMLGNYLDVLEEVLQTKLRSLKGNSQDCECCRCDSAWEQWPDSFTYSAFYFSLTFPPEMRFRGFPSGTSGKELVCQCRRHKKLRFNPWVGKIPWRRKRQPTPVFLPGESHGQRSLVGYSPWGRTESDIT